MNERIKELAIQAGFFYEDYKDIWYLEYHNETCEEEMKKFAESIIKECARIADEKLPYVGCGYITKTKGMLIKEHFGVDYEL